MTAIYIAAIILQLGVIVYFFTKGRRPLKGKKADSYEAKRDAALSVTASQLNLRIPAEQTFVYGVVMDWNLGESVVTLATYITGAANLYLSGGGGVSGGGVKPNVGEAAVRLVNAAQDFLSRALPAAANELPPPNCVRFYLLTNRQLYAGQEHVSFLDDSTSPWIPLFNMGNEVIAEMRN